MELPSFDQWADAYLCVLTNCIFGYILGILGQLGPVVKKGVCVCVCVCVAMVHGLGQNCPVTQSGV